MLSFEFPWFLMRLRVFSHVPGPLNCFCDLAVNLSRLIFPLIVWHLGVICRVFLYFYILLLMLCSLPLLITHMQKFPPDLSLVILLSHHFIRVAQSASWIPSYHSMLLVGKHCLCVPYTGMLLKWEPSMLVDSSKVDQVQILLNSFKKKSFINLFVNGKLDSRQGWFLNKRTHRSCKTNELRSWLIQNDRFFPPFRYHLISCTEQRNVQLNTWLMCI